jgi:lipid-A-disaccharide synthase
MQTVGGNLVVHYQKLAFMGFWEVIKNLFTLSKYIKQCKRDIAGYQPDALILVDYSGFNLRIAPFAKKIGIPVHYYIAPKIWAWNEKRIKKIKKSIDHLYVIFPFEKAYFKDKHKYPVHYVGNPLQDVISNRKQIDETKLREKYLLGNKPIIALLPGSRAQEIKHMLPLMLQISKHYTDYQFVIAGAPNRDKAYYQEYTKDVDVRFIPNNTYDLLSISYAALVTSGTATLETALFKIPQVVCYKTSAFTYTLGKMLIKSIKYISLVNLVMDAPIVVELIQQDYNEIRLREELNAILATKKRTEMFENYHVLEDLLGKAGASDTVADWVISLNKE